MSLLFACKPAMQTFQGLPGAFDQSLSTVKSIEKIEYSIVLGS